MKDLHERHDAVYLAGGQSLLALDADHASRFTSADFKEGIATVVEAVAEGRRIAGEIQKSLTG